MKSKVKHKEYVSPFIPLKTNIGKVQNNSYVPPASKRVSHSLNRAKGNVGK